MSSSAESTPATTPEPPRAGDAGAATTKLTRGWKITIAAVIAVIIVLAAIIIAVANRPQYTVEQATAPATANPVFNPATSPEGTPDMAPVAKAAKAKELGDLSAEVTDLTTGEVLFAKNENKAMVPASSTKVYTSAAAWLSVGHDHRIPTSVVQGEPDELIIVGEGDVTLSKTPGSGFFTDAAAVSDLASKIKKVLSSDDAEQKIGDIKKITIDNSLREKSTFHKSWSKNDIGNGNVAELDSVMIDAGRDDPEMNYSPRSLEPAKEVGKTLGAQLGLKDFDVTVADSTDAPKHPTAEESLGQVFSAPLSTRIRDMMLHSDNLLAEAIGREVAAANDAPGTFEGATESILAVLQEHGVDTGGAVLHDASGMSEDNRLSAHNLDSALSNAEMHDLLRDLPVARVEGTLADRYIEGSGAEDAAGWVRAKTGTLDGVSALAGTVTTKSGRPVSFAFLSNGSDVTSSRDALDRLAAAVYRI